VIRIVLADDHPIVTEGLALIFEDQSDLAIVGTASTAAQTVAIVAREKPQVLILDLEFPDASGLDVLDRVRLLDDPPRIVIFTAYGGSARISETVAHGADSYVLKGTPSSELLRAIRSVANGRTYIPAELSGELADALREPARERLTPRELQILRLMAAGRANKEIATELHIAERTVKFHVSEIFSRLNATNRAHAVSLARARGLL
jgi:DNA-binding NarL/FixJ family response regulator